MVIRNTRDGTVCNVKQERFVVKGCEAHSRFFFFAVVGMTDTRTHDWFILCKSIWFSTQSIVIVWRKMGRDRFDH